MEHSAKKQKPLTIQEKLAVIEMVEGGKSVKQVADGLGISKNTLHYIVKNRKKLREEVERNPARFKQKRMKQAKCPELETAILNFISESREKGDKVTGSIIKSMALELAFKMDVNNFSASNGWLFSFCKRNGISMSDFNKGSRPQKEVTEESSVGFDQIEESQYQEQVSAEQSLMEYTEIIENTVEETESVTNHTNEWKNWCRLCGNIESMHELEPNMMETVQQLVEISTNDVIKVCNNCYSSVQDILSFVTKGKICESMYQELAEWENANCLTNENMMNIRQEYGIDELYENCTEEHLIESDLAEDELSLQEDEELSQDIKTEENLENCNIEKIQYEALDDDDIVEEIIQSSPQKSQLLADEENYIYNCHVCDETFERMCFLTNHTCKAHDCLPQVPCYICGKILQTWESLMAHKKRKHSTDIPANFCCDTCGSSFSTKIGLSIHIKFKHERPAVHHHCSVCNKEFKDAAMLKNHKRIHLPDDEKFPYECSLCSKKLANKYSLKHHIASVHKGEKTVSCSICSRAFSSKSNLRSHLISHTIENVQCQVCNAVFKNRVSLQGHKKIHKPKESLKFACSVCNKRFHNRYHLQRHAVCHTQEKNFVCNYENCTMAYKWEKDLNNHLSMHYGERKHKCMWCERSFIDSANMRKHKMKYHKEELAEYEEKYGKKRSNVINENF